MDVVYVVRCGANPELRYSLRSLTHLPHDRVWIVGYAPAWLTGARVIEVAQRRTKAENVVANWRRALADPELPDEFVVMHDDMFVMEPVDELPVLHAGPLADHVASMGRGGYAGGIQRTIGLLRGMGYDEPLSYELHVPMLASKAAWAKAIEHKQQDSRLALRSMFGAFASIGGTLAADVKVRDPLDRTVPAGPFLSTSDLSWPTSTAGKTVRARFGQPCRYERDGRR